MRDAYRLGMALGLSIVSLAVVIACAQAPAVPSAPPVPGASPAAVPPAPPGDVDALLASVERVAASLRRPTPPAPPSCASAWQRSPYAPRPSPA